jgi:hypothetical protein
MLIERMRKRLSAERAARAKKRKWTARAVAMAAHLQPFIQGLLKELPPGWRCLA